MVVGGGLLALGICAPWGVGKVTEQQWQEATRELNSAQSFFRLETRDYERRFFDADLNGSLIFHDPGSGKTTVIPYHGEVSHGVIGSRLDFSTPDTDSGVALELFPDDKPSLVLQSRLWGTITVELNVPAISIEDPATGESLNMAESYGWASIREAGAEADIELRWPGLVARGPGMRLALDDLRVSQVASRIRGGVWSGEGDVSLARLDLTYPDQPPLTLEQLSLHSKTWAEDGERAFSSGTTVDLANIDIADDRYGPHHLEFVIDGANIDAWNRVTAAFSEVQASTVGDTSPRVQLERQMQLMMQLSSALRELAGNGIRIGMPEVVLQSPQGPVTGALELRHPALSEQERSQMLMVMQRLRGDLNLAVPVALVNTLPQLKARLAPMIAEGLLVQDGEVYRLDAKLNDLAVDVNGRAIPLPPLI